MNELLEMLELKNELDSLIESAIDQLSDKELKVLEEASLGTMISNAAKSAKNIATKVGKGTGVLKLTPVDLVKRVNKNTNKNINTTLNILKKKYPIDNITTEKIRRAEVSKIGKYIKQHKNAVRNILGAERAVRLLGTGVVAGGAAKYAHIKKKNKEIEDAKLKNRIKRALGIK